MSAGEIADAYEAAGALLGQVPENVEPLKGGGNNRVYRIVAAGKSYALKRYPIPGDDPRDRLAQEFAALHFLKQVLPDAPVPSALASDERRRFALYEWVEGIRVQEHDLADIDSAAALLKSCHLARLSEGAAELRDASEAVFSCETLLAQISKRWEKLTAVPNEPGVAQFLRVAFQPALDAVKRSLSRIYLSEGWVTSVPLNQKYRTLSPSDYGFHNALRRNDGRLMFIDFEYFGWDDPVKLTADFMWHPGMTLGSAERERFLSRARETYSSDPTFDRRFEAHSPLFALRWALIVLNEFLPEVWARRVEAGATLDHESAKRVQLAKAYRFTEAVR